MRGLLAKAEERHHKRRRQPSNETSPGTLIHISSLLRLSKNSIFPFHNCKGGCKTSPACPAALSCCTNADNKDAVKICDRRPNSYKAGALQVSPAPHADKSVKCRSVGNPNKASSLIAQ